jgi:hypothetical protein
MSAACAGSGWKCGRAGERRARSLMIRMLVMKRMSVSECTMVFGLVGGGLKCLYDHSRILEERFGKPRISQSRIVHEDDVLQNLLSFFRHPQKSVSCFIIKDESFRYHKIPSSHHLPPHSSPQHRCPQTPIRPSLLHPSPPPYPFLSATSSPNTPLTPSSSLP